jgi:predicted outer membrane protein
MNNSEDCRAYAEHLYREHSRINHLLRDLSQRTSELRTASDAASRAWLAGRLADLRRELSAHFAEEEAGACLEEAVTRCPSLGADAKAILAEHSELDRALETLIAQAGDPAVTTQTLAQCYRTFADKLQAHDALETRLLQMAFGAETADYDEG